MDGRREGGMHEPMTCATPVQHLQFVVGSEFHCRLLRRNELRPKRRRGSKSRLSKALRGL